MKGKPRPTAPGRFATFATDDTTPKESFAVVGEGPAAIELHVRR